MDDDDDGNCRELPDVNYIQGEIERVYTAIRRHLPD